MSTDSLDRPLPDRHNSLPSAGPLPRGLPAGLGEELVSDGNGRGLRARRVRRCGKVTTIKAALALAIMVPAANAAIFVNNDYRNSGQTFVFRQGALTVQTITAGAGVEAAITAPVGWYRVDVYNSTPTLVYQGYVPVSSEYTAIEWAGWFDGTAGENVGLRVIEPDGFPAMPVSDQFWWFLKGFLYASIPCSIALAIRIFKSTANDGEV